MLDFIMILWRFYVFLQHILGLKLVIEQLV